MNAVAFLSTALLAPWRSTRRSLHLSASVFLLLAVVIVALIGLLSHKPHAPLATDMAAILAIGLAFFNGFVLSPTLLLAIDARQLCLPGLQRTAWMSLVIYAGLELLPATLTFAWLSGDAATAGAILMLGSTAGICWGLLPRYVNFFIGFGPMAFNTFHDRLQLPVAGQPGFLAWITILALLGVAAAAVCWQRELHAKAPYAQGMSRPLVTQFRNNSRGGWNAWSGFAGGASDTSLMIRQRPNWMQPRTDLKGTGPLAIPLSLRVALGGLFMPQTWSSRVRGAISVILPGLALVLLMGLMVHANHKEHIEPVLRKMAVGAMLWGGGFGGIMSVLISVTQLQQRWSKSNGELPLLALLPGLGTPSTIRHDLLAASLFPLRIQLVLLVVTVALACYLGIRAEGLFLIALCQLVSMGGVVALQLCVFGRRIPSGWILMLLCILGFSVLTASLTIAVIDGHSLIMAPDWLQGILAAGWSALILALLWLGRRGGRAWKMQAHPFLVP